MPAAEIAMGFTSLKAAFDITKAMVDLRDAETFRSRAIELQGVIAEALGQVIEAREAHSAQIDRIRALETEVADLKGWGAEKESYELKTIGRGSVAYMLKPEARGASPPHWLCPNCYAQGKKAFFQGTGAMTLRHPIYACAGCKGSIATDGDPEWID